MYQALYRKWRPLTFDDVVGQDHITATLKRQVQTDRLSHAYLFIGTRGTGKTTCAKILARAVNCEHPVDGNPCNQCAACRGLLDGSILDVVELDAASNNGVSDVRALQDEAIFSPASVKKRVYIIDEVHMLSTPAFNALLKILEEPPEHLMFILCTTELHKVLPTIVSRCQRHSFKRIEPDAIAGRLRYVAEQEGMDLTEDAASLLARLADGGMRDALSLLDQCSAHEHIDMDAVYSAMGLAGSRRITELLDAICAGAADRALTLFDSLWKSGKDPAGILEELADLMRDVLLLQVAPRNGDALLSGIYDIQELRRFAASMPADRLMDGMASIRAADLSGSNPRRAAEMCLAGLCTPEIGDTVAALRARVSRLEALVKNGVPAMAAPSPGPEPYSPPAPEPAQPPEEDVPFRFSDEDAPPEDEEFLPPAPVPAYEPEQEPVPKPASPLPAAPGPAAVPTDTGAEDGVWDELVRRLNGKLDLGTYSMLRTSSQCYGRLRGSVMTVYLATPISKLLLDTPATVSLFRQELEEMTNRSIRVEFTDEPETASPAAAVSKLDELGKYANVKFD